MKDADAVMMNEKKAKTAKIHMKKVESTMRKVVTEAVAVKITVKKD